MILVGWKIVIGGFGSGGLDVSWIFCWFFIVGIWFILFCVVCVFFVVC